MGPRTKAIALETAEGELRHATRNPRWPAQCAHPGKPHDLSFIGWADAQTSERRVEVAQARVDRLRGA